MSVLHEQLLTAKLLMNDIYYKGFLIMINLSFIA
jgi:hypothetical protein